MATFLERLNARAAELSGGADFLSRLDARESELARTSDVKLVATTRDGEIFEDAEGNLSFKSPGYATSDPEVIQRLLQGDDVKTVVQSGFDDEVLKSIPKWGLQGQKVVEGLPFVGSYFDEAVGLVSPEMARDMRLGSEAMQRQNPGQSNALALSGGVLGSVPLAMAAGPKAMATLAGKTRLGQAALGMFGGAVGGATEGAIYGAGRGEGGGRLENAGAGAGIGGAIGGAMGFAAPFARDVVEAGLRRFKRSDVSQIAGQLRISREAAEVVKEALDAGNMDDAIDALRKAGPDAMLMDAGKPAQALAQAASKSGGAATSIVSDAVEARARGANRAIRGSLDASFGPTPSGVMSVADEIAERTAPARKAAYNSAYSKPVDYASPEGMRIEETLSRVPPKMLLKAVNEANEEMWSKGQRNMQILAEIADDGSVAFREMPNVQQLDEIKKALGNAGAVEVDNFNRPTAKGRRYNRLAGQVKEAIGEAVPEYLDAVKIGGDKIEMDRALEMGGKLFNAKTTREEVARFVGGLSKDGRAALKAGVRQQFDEAMANVRKVASDPNIDARQVRKMLDDVSSEAARTKLKIILGPKDAKRLIGDLRRFETAMSARAAVSRNSDTAINQAIQGKVEDISQRGIARKAMRGELSDASKGVVQVLTGATDKAASQRTASIFEDIARALTETRGAKAQGALKLVRKAMDGQKLTNSQARFVADALVGTTYLSGSRSGQQLLMP